MLFGRLHAAGQGWAEDQAAQMGAALSYYTLFSLAPLLIVAMLVLGTVLGEAETKKYLLEQAGSFLNEEGTRAVETLLESFLSTQGKAATSLIGAGSLLLGATGMFTSLRSSLRRIWRLQADQQGLVISVVKTYLLAILMVFVTCTFLLVLLLVSTMMPHVSQLGIFYLPSFPGSGPLVDFLVSTLLLTLLSTFTFRFLSDGRLPYRQLWFGALITAILFSVGKIGIGLYLSFTNLASLYGAAGSLAVFLAWVYYSAQILFFGAEVVRVSRAD